MSGLGGRLPGLGAPSGLWGGVPGLWDGVLGLGGNEYARYTALASIAHNPADLTGLFTTATGGVNAVPGDPVGFIADCAGSNGKTFAQVMAGAADIKSGGVVGLVGTATAASYDSVTGAGSVTRVDGPNQSYVTWTGLNSWHQIAITNTGSVSVAVRSGTFGGPSPVVLAAGQSTTAMVAPTTGVITITTASVTGTATFTVHSVKEVPGFPYYQTTAGARPILARMPKGGRRNLLTWTEDFSNAAWSKNPTTTSVLAADDFWLISNTTGEANQYIGQAASTSSAGTTYTYTLDILAGTASTCAVGIGINADPADGGSIWGTVASTSVEILSGPGTASSTSLFVISNLSDTIPTRVRVSRHYTTGGIVTRPYVYPGEHGAGSPRSIKLRRPQFETGSVATPYQKVTNTYDVTEAGVASVYALVGDGLSKCMVSDAVNPGTDKVTVVAGVRKLSDAAQSVLLELGANASTINGSFNILAPNSVGANFGARSRGSAATAAAGTLTTFPSPLSAVVSTLNDISAPNCQVFVNGVSASQDNTTAQGGGNYGNHQLFLMARNQASAFFNGFWFGDHISWKNHAANDLAFIEKQMAKNTMQVAP